MSEVKTNKITSLASNNDITLDPDGTGAVVVDAGHSLGVGTASPESFYSLADDIVLGTGSGGRGLTIYSGSSDSGYIGFNDTASASMQASSSIITTAIIWLLLQTVLKKSVLKPADFIYLKTIITLPRPVMNLTLTVRQDAPIMMLPS